MKTLVVFYSRTGTTRKVGEALTEMLGADMEEVKDTVNRSGIKGYFFAGRDAWRRRLTKLEPIIKNPAEYELVVIGTPIWAANMSSPIRTYLTEQKSVLGKVAFFCTMAGQGDEKAFKEMKEIIGKEPIATLTALTRKVVRGEHQNELNEFVNKLK